MKQNIETLAISPLIRTKLSPPQLGRGRADRKPLLDLLDERRDRAVTLIVGPIGSGKTMVSALWRQRLMNSGVSVGWYNVGASEDEHLWLEYWFAALRQAGLDIGPNLVAAVLAEDVDINRLVALTVNALLEKGEPTVIFLDDLHKMRSPRIYEFLNYFIEYSPSNFQLVITSRRSLPLTLEPLRLQDQLTEIGFEQLRLSPGEQASFLEGLGVTELSAAHHRRLYTVAEGWAAPLQLISLAMKKSGNAEGVLAQVSTGTLFQDNDSLRAYFEDAIDQLVDLKQLPFLVRISACDTFNSDLCAAVCDDREAAGLVSLWAEQNLLIVSIESEDGLQWYRFHAAFLAFLRQRLAKLPAEELITLDQRAADWFASHGLTSEAIRHARRANDIDRLASLISSAARGLLYSGQYLQLCRLTDGLPLHMWGDRIEALISIGWSQIAMHRASDAERTLAAIDAHPDRSDPQIDMEVRLMRSLQLLVRDDSHAAMQPLREVLDASAELNGFCLLMLGIVGSGVLVGEGEFNRARDLTHECQVKLRQQLGDRPRPFLDYLPGYSFLVQGDFHQARDGMSEVLRQLENEGAIAEYSAAHVAGCLADVFYQLDELDSAEDYVDLFTNAFEAVRNPDTSLYGILARARLLFARGNLGHAIAALNDLERLAQDEGWDRHAAWSLAERVRMLGSDPERMTAMREAVRRLRRLASRYANESVGTLAEIRIAAVMAEVDAGIADQDWDTVTRLALPSAKDAERRGRMFLAARLRVGAATALHEQGQVAEALHEARHVLPIAETYGMRRLFLDHGDAGRHLVRSLRASKGLRAPESRHLDRLLEMRLQANAIGPSGSEALLDQGSQPLSPKEREIVLLLSRGLSIKTTARLAQVTPGTVKWHLKNIYIKLGVITREEAVIKARALGIISK